uniref:Zinc knuckle CX2CX4HX4C n=1 Tax=Tanacetum cinerariifolium TaxID=118510 RepID=A0A6L2NI85_TANCI|nr:hypothetical protein [Tanacetum cinerariifolium]
MKGQAVETFRPDLSYQDLRIFPGGNGACAHRMLEERCGNDSVRRGYREIGWGRRMNSAEIWREKLLNSVRRRVRVWKNCIFGPCGDRKGFFSQNGVGEKSERKQHGLANDAANGIVNVVSSAVKSPIIEDHVELKNIIVVATLKLAGERFNMCTIRVGYEWKPPRCSSCKVFGHVLGECPIKIVSDVVKNLNNPRQANRGVSVSPNVSFKYTKQIHRCVSNKNDASSSGEKKQAEVARQVVSYSNPFDALNLIENDDDLGMNEGNSISARKGVASSSISTTPIAKRIDKIERRMIKGKLLFVDDDEKPLQKVVSMVNTYSVIEMEEKKTKRDDDYDPYDDDLYDSHDMFDNL